MTEVKRPTRRTQRQRREATIAALVSATIEAIMELGYARASVKEICRRAGVSEGALFRHFPTRRDLVILAAEQVSKLQLEWFLADYEKDLQKSGDPLLTAMKLMRRGARSPNNMVWYELVIAARTDEDLMERLRPSIDERYSIAVEFAKNLLGPSYSAEFVSKLTFTLLHLFNGEALARSLFPVPEMDETTLKTMVDAVSGAAPTGE